MDAMRGRAVCILLATRAERPIRANVLAGAKATPTVLAIRAHIAKPTQRTHRHAKASHAIPPLAAVSIITTGELLLAHLQAKQRLARTALAISALAALVFLGAGRAPDAEESAGHIPAHLLAAPAAQASDLLHAWIGQAIEVAVALERRTAHRVAYIY